MRKCEQCLYYPKCDECPFDESGCDHFKDRSLFVELPCRIGSDLWWISSETHTVECIKGGVKGFVVKDDNILVLDGDGSTSLIGTQYCYLSKENAEKALRERIDANADN